MGFKSKFEEGIISAINNAGPEGVTTREIADATGCEITHLYHLLSRMRKKGSVVYRKTKTGLRYYGLNAGNVPVVEASPPDLSAFGSDEPFGKLAPMKQEEFLRLQKTLRIKSVERFYALAYHAIIRGLAFGYDAD